MRPRFTPRWCPHMRALEPSHCLHVRAMKRFNDPHDGQLGPVIGPYTQPACKTQKPACAANRVNKLSTHGANETQRRHTNAGNFCTLIACECRQLEDRNCLHMRPIHPCNCPHTRVITRMIWMAAGRTSPNYCPYMRANYKY